MAEKGSSRKRSGRRALEDLLEQLSAARERPTGAATVDLLRKNLRGRSSHAAAKAADICADIGADSLRDERLAREMRELLG